MTFRGSANERDRREKSSRMIEMLYEGSIDGYISAESKFFFGEQSPLEWFWERILFCVHEGRLLLSDVLQMSLPRIGTTVRIVKRYRKGSEDTLDE